MKELAVAAKEATSTHKSTNSAYFEPDSFGRNLVDLPRLSHEESSVFATSFQQPQKPDTSLYQHACSITVGCLAFGCTLATSTFLQQRVLGVSTGTTPPVPTVLGVLTVSLASLVCHDVANHVSSRLQKHRFNDVTFRSQLSKAGWSSKVDAFVPPHQWKKVVDGVHRTAVSVAEIAEDVSATLEHSYAKVFGHQSRSHKWAVDISTWFKEHNNFMTPHNVKLCILGLVTYRLCGGRFWSIAPSSYTAPGSFARMRLPSSSPGHVGTDYATQATREQMQQWGKKYGCHTCGTRGRNFFRRSVGTMTTKSVFFHADHMPPNAIAKRLNRAWYRSAKWIPPLLRAKPVQQWFYPQCVTCSHKQGKILASATASAMAPTGGTGALLRAGGGAAAHFHGIRSLLRPANVGAGAVISGATAAGALQRDDDKL